MASYLEAFGRNEHLPPLYWLVQSRTEKQLIGLGGARACHLWIEALARDEVALISTRNEWKTTILGWTIIVQVPH